MISKYYEKYDANKLDSEDNIDKFTEKPQITKYSSRKSRKSGLTHGK